MSINIRANENDKLGYTLVIRCHIWVPVCAPFLSGCKSGLLLLIVKVCWELLIYRCVGATPILYCCMYIGFCLQNDMQILFGYIGGADIYVDKASVVFGDTPCSRGRFGISSQPNCFFFVGVRFDTILLLVRSCSTSSLRSTVNSSVKQ